MKKIEEFLSNMNSETLIVLIAAAVLLIALLVIIIVTIKFMHGNKLDEYDDEDYYDEYEDDYPDRKKKKKKAKHARNYDEEDYDDEDSEDFEEEAPKKSERKSEKKPEKKPEKRNDKRFAPPSDKKEERPLKKEEKDTNTLVRETVEAVERVRKQAEAEIEAAKAKEAEEAAAEVEKEISKVEAEKAIQEVLNEKPEDKKPVEEEDDFFDEEEDEDEKVSEPTRELDTEAVKEALIVSKLKEAALLADEPDIENIAASDMGNSKTAKKKAKSPDYDASFDSAFIDTNKATEPTIIAQPKKEEPKPVETAPVAPAPVADAPAMEEAAAPARVEANAPEAFTEDAPIEAPETVQAEQSEAEKLEEKLKATRKEGDKITVNPANAVNINTVNTLDAVNTVNTAAGIGSMAEVENYLTENPVPKRKKVKKRDRKYDEKFGIYATDSIKSAKYFWYNNQDIENLRRKEDMYFYCHYFENPEKEILKLVTEMYDCAFVRTEEIQKIAFGINFRSMSMKDILQADQNTGFNRAGATKEPTEEDLKMIYQKWCSYVDNFLKIIVINATDNVKAYIKKELYNYGKNDPEILLYSPE